MRIPVLLSSLSALVALLLTQQASAQDDVEAEADPNRFRRLHYIDEPVPMEPGLDPVMPEVSLPLDPEQDPRFAERMESIRDYSELVLEIESSSGIWNQSLIEELDALGSLQQQQGDHLAAISSFDRAIHVNRINDGLHTLDQIPLVEKMIDSHIALGNWEQADLYNNYLYFVQQKAYGADDPRIIPVLDRLAEWHIQAFNVGYGEPIGMHLSSAQILFNAAARMVSVHFGRDDERFVKLLRNTASSAYLVSTHPEYMVEIDRPEYRITTDTLRQQLNERYSGTMGFTAGEQALREIIELYQEQETSYELAEAITHLADWYLLFERRRPARELYAEAWQILEQMEDGAELNARLFGQVIPIPTFAAQDVNLDRSSNETRTGGNLDFEYADVVFDVNENGAVRNVRILTEQTPENESNLSRLLREIRNSRFRPVVVDGLVIRTDDHHFRYRYWY